MGEEFPAREIKTAAAVGGWGARGKKNPAAIFHFVTEYQGRIKSTGAELFQQKGGGRACNIRVVSVETHGGRLEEQVSSSGQRRGDTSPDGGRGGDGGGTDPSVL